MLIDLVYTYVNGYDENFIQKKNNYLSEKDKINNQDIRFNDINEINYSIKSVFKFLPWINNIFIVTDNQIPLLDQNFIDTGKVKIIDHKDIIPEKYLPTFFSDVIESFLHNIPELSEIFIYNNDDCLFFDYIYQNDIYEINNNKIKLKIINNFSIDIIKKKKSEYSKRIINTANILYELECTDLITPFSLKNGTFV